MMELLPDYKDITNAQEYIDYHSSPEVIRYVKIHLKVSPTLKTFPKLLTPTEYRLEHDLHTRIIQQQSNEQQDKNRMETFEKLLAPEKKSTRKKDKRQLGSNLEEISPRKSRQKNRPPEDPANLFEEAFRSSRKPSSSSPSSPVEVVDDEDTSTSMRKKTNKRKRNDEIACPAVERIYLPQVLEIPMNETGRARRGILLSIKETTGANQSVKYELDLWMQKDDDDEKINEDFLKKFMKEHPIQADFVRRLQLDGYEQFTSPSRLFPGRRLNAYTRCCFVAEKYRGISLEMTRKKRIPFVEPKWAPESASEEDDEEEEQEEEENDEYGEQELAD